MRFANALILAVGVCLVLQACSNEKKIIATENRAPSTPQALAPADNSTDQLTVLLLTWQCSDPDDDNLTYDLYLGTQSDPPLAASGLTQAEFDPGYLEYGTSYKWRVVARDEHGASVSSPVWRFETTPTTGLYLVGSCNLNTWPSSYTIFQIAANLAFAADAIDWNSVMWIYDISDAEHPAFATRFVPTAYITDLAIKGHNAYLTESNGLEVLDISSPLTPRRIGLFRDLGRLHSIAMQGDYAYVSGWPGIYAIDISNPESLIVIDSCDGTGKIRISGNYAFIGHDCDLESGCIDSYEILPDHKLNLSGSLHTQNTLLNFFVAYHRLFVLTYWDDIIAWDFSQPSAPLFAYRFAPPEFGAYLALFAYGDILYLASTISNEHSLQMYDVSDIRNPVLISSFPLIAPAMGIFVANNYVYLIDQAPSLKILAYLP